MPWLRTRRSVTLAGCSAFAGAGPPPAWATGGTASAWYASTPAPAAATTTPRNTAVTPLSLVSSMVFNTLSASATTLAETAPAATFPAENRVAALTVEATSGAGTPPDAPFGDNAAANDAADSATPRRVSRRDSIFRAAAS